MFSFLMRKMLNNKWMIISLLVGNILMIATVASVPLYKNATLHRMLVKEMQEYQTVSEEDSVLSEIKGYGQVDEEYPALIELKLIFMNNTKIGIDGFVNTREILNKEILNAFSIPTLAVTEEVAITNTQFDSETPREEKRRAKAGIVTARTDLEDHITIVKGRMFSNEIQDGVIEAVVNQRTMDKMDLLMDEVLVEQRHLVFGVPLKIKIVGIFTNSNETDPYWTQSPNVYSSNLLISHDLMEQIVLSENPSSFRITTTWQQIYDYNRFEIRSIPRYIEADAKYSDIKAVSSTYAITYKNTFIPIISSYQDKADSLSVTLLVLQVPVFMLLAFFTYMVSRQILKIEQDSISVIKSRGASRRQIISIYFMQGLIICAVGMPIGMPLAVLICKVLGSSSGFLNLVQRSALNVALIPEAFIYSGIAALFSLAAMTLPVFGYSKVTIVDHKRSKAAGQRKPLWQMFFLDFAALALSLYSLYSMTKRQEAFAISVKDINSVDPLLFLSSSLFILGMGLVALRLYPYLIKFIYMVFKKLWPPAFYASFLRLIRSGGDEQFIMIFLVFTLAVGIFDAKAARTINLNSEDKIMYSAGADLVYKERWQDNSVYDKDGVKINQNKIVYTEPDFGRFTSFADVVSAAKVYRDNVNVIFKEGDRSDGIRSDVELMAVNTKSFGLTAWYRNDLFGAHFYEYLNSLAVKNDAVLLSTNFKTTYGYALNDTITFQTNSGDTVTGTIHGFIDYWPGFKNLERIEGEDGLYSEIDKWLIVSNLNYIQSNIGVLPYEVWMKTGSSSNRFIYDFAKDNKSRFVMFKDSKSEVVSSLNAPLLQGMNGVLTVGFIIIIIVCATGFLIYWILAIKSRVLQFGVFRAMGMGFKNIIGMLIIEQVLITGAGLSLGVLVGEIASRLFVPIIQLAYMASEKLIPFLIVIQSEDYIRLLGITGIMIVFCLSLLGVFVSRIKIAQALKLGED